jgi:hypothetical protein
MRRRLALAGALVMGLALAFAPAVSAAAPWYEPMDRTDGTTLDAGALCPFAVDMSWHQVGWTNYYSSNGGTPVKKIEHYWEADTLSANGVTLVGIPFEVNLYFAVDSDFNLTRIDASGGLLRIPLPDGHLVVSAGHITFDGQVGNLGNMDALCAALAG